MSKPDPELEMRRKLKLGMRLAEVQEVYPGFGVLMEWGEQILGRPFVDLAEFLDYYEGRKQYPPSDFQKRLAS